MSIYGTGSVFKLETDHDIFVEICEQVVPAWVDFECDYLPPPRLGINEMEGYEHPRAVVFVEAGSNKGGEGFGGQQYHDPPPLLVMSGEEYERAKFHEVMDKLYDAAHALIESRRGSSG